ncbi:MAG TPA: hypothetical protein VFM18_00440, partial [Methanosarcina sp.]|nr:hypothetical protein [Methanosarcina sp.]
GTGSTLNFTTMSYSGAVVNVGSIAGIASDTVGGGVLTFGVPKAGVSSEIARIDPAGLLVGTTNSGYSSSGRGLIELNGSTDSVIGLRVGGNNRAFFQATNGNDLIISNQTATGSTSFYMSSSPKVTIISTGFVGMGTTSPSEIIHAKGSATDVSVRLENTTSGTKVWNLTSGGGTTISTGSFAIRNVTDSTTPLQIGNGDKVGLGINPNTSGTENSGRLILSSDANSGVFFGNTANAAKNVLDWYEEGTFTPLVFGGTTPGTGTYAYNTGMYTRIGSLLFIKMKIGYTVHTGTGELWIGIPYTTGSSPPPALSNSSFANGSVPVLMNPALSGYCTYSMAATIGSGGYAMYNISRQNLSSGAIDTFSISDCTNKVMNISGVLSL